MDNGIPIAVVYRKILEKVIIKAVYDQNDDFLYWAHFTNNKKTINQIFPDIDLSEVEFNTNPTEAFETFNLHTGERATINLNKLDCVSIPELPLEFSPVFLFNERFEDKIKNFPFQKIQRKTIFELKKHGIVANKDSVVITPKVEFFAKVKPGCDVLRILNVDLLSNRKITLKTAFTNYKRETNKHFKFLFSELNHERKVLEKRLKRGCPFAQDSLKSLDELEEAAKKDQENIRIENYTIPLDMLTSWPKSLLPLPDWIVTDNNIITSLHSFKNNIVFNKESLVTFYTDIAKNIGEFYEVEVLDLKSNTTEKKLLGVKIDEEKTEILSIPYKDYVADQISFEPFNTIINTNAYAILHLTFENDDEKYVETKTGYSLSAVPVTDEAIEKWTIETNEKTILNHRWWNEIVIKDVSDNPIYRATRTSNNKVSLDQVTERLNKFLVVG